MREGRWVLPDLRGKGGRVRTVAIPIWVKHGIDAWMVEAKIEGGRLLRPLSKSGKLIGDERWATGRFGRSSSNLRRRLELSDSGHTICAGRARSFVARAAVIWNKSSFCLGIARFKRRSDILVRNRTWLLL
jgi:hypothetical protein